MKAANDDKMYKYQVVKSMLLNDIHRYPHGKRLHNRNSLAKKYGVARITIERAISELIGEGILTSKDGSGTYVNKSTIQETSEQNEPPKVKVRTRDESSRPSWALVTGNVTYDTNPIIFNSIESVARKCGYNLVVHITNNLASRQEECLKNVLNSDCSGIIILPAITGDTRLETLHKLRSEGIPIVSAKRQIPGFLAPSVLCNSFAAGLVGTEHLIKCGCSRIAYIASYSYSTSIDRYSGYCCALDRAKLPRDMRLVCFDDRLNEQEPGMKGIERLFSKEEIDFDGIYAFNDRVALQIHNKMQEKGLVMGSDIKLVTCDDTQICSILKLTTAKESVAEMAERSAYLLNEICQGNQVDINHTEIFDNTFIIRESCGYELKNNTKGAV